MPFASKMSEMYVLNKPKTTQNIMPNKITLIIIHTIGSRLIIIVVSTPKNEHIIGIGKQIIIL